MKVHAAAAAAAAVTGTRTGTNLMELFRNCPFGTIRYLDEYLGANNFHFFSNVRGNIALCLLESSSTICT
jgi:hypothetical protein